MFRLYRMKQVAQYTVGVFILIRNKLELPLKKLLKVFRVAKLQSIREIMVCVKDTSISTHARF
ncbi:hypothetical protein D3C76_1848500 [compost metagenome]